MFLKTLQNSQKNLCTIVSFLIKLQLKKRLWRRCFPVNIARFLRRPILIKHLWWLPLVKLESYLWNQKNFSSSYFCVHLISYVPSTLWRNSCKTPYPQKNVCGGVHSFSNSNLKTFKLRYKQFAVICTQPFNTLGTPSLSNYWEGLLFIF